MAIVVIAGAPGNGKGVYTMSMVEDAARSGRPVYTNMVLTKKCPYYDKVALIDDPEGKYPVYRGEPGKPDYLAFWHYVLPGSVVIIDEADLYFDCTDHSAMGRDIRAFLKQHRKLGLDIVFIVQNIQNLYIRIRRLTQRFIICEWNYRSVRAFQTLASIFGVEWAINRSRFFRAEFPSEDLSERAVMAEGFITYREARDKYFGWYDTEQLLGDLSHLRWLTEKNDDHARNAEGPTGDGAGHGYRGAAIPGRTPAAETEDNDLPTAGRGSGVSVALQTENRRSLTSLTSCYRTVRRFFASLLRTPASKGSK